jgi:hypothetical protein
MKNETNDPGRGSVRAADSFHFRFTSVSGADVVVNEMKNETNDPGRGSVRTADSFHFRFTSVSGADVVQMK